MQQVRWFRTKSVWLGLVFVLFLVVRHFLWVHTNPMFQGPDEVQHLFLVGQLDAHGMGVYENTRLPQWHAMLSSANWEEDYYQQRDIVARYERRQQFTEHARWGVAERENLHQTAFTGAFKSTQETYNVYSYPPFYYLSLAALMRLVRATLEPTLVGYQFGIRLFSAFWYAVFVFFWWRTLRRLLDPVTSFGILLCLSLHPMFVFMTSVTNNDASLLAGSAVLLHGAFRLLSRDQGWRTWCALALGAAAMVLSKSHGTMFACMALGVLGLDALRRRSGREVASLSSIVVGGLALHLLMARWLGQPTLAGTASPMSLGRYLRFVLADGPGWLLLQNTFGQFAWLEVKFPEATYNAFAGVLALILALSLVLWLRQRSDTPIAARYALVVFVGAWALMLSAQFVLMPKVGFIMQGRYVLAMFPLVYLLLGLLLSHWAQQGRRALLASRLILVGAAIALSVANDYSLVLIAERFYGLGPGLLDRVAQYKPAYFKSDLVILGGAAAMLLSQLVLLLSLGWRLYREPRSVLVGAGCPR